MLDPNGCDNESIGSGETEKISTPRSSAQDARLFSTNTQATQWREGKLIFITLKCLYIASKCSCFSVRNVRNLIWI